MGGDIINQLVKDQKRLHFYKGLNIKPIESFLPGDS
jgi:hypothetical protein